MATARRAGIEGAAVAPQRFVEVDLLKAAGIVAVVLIHALRTRWDPAQSAIERVLIDVSRFGVPAFLASSGFLYATHAVVPWATTRRRLARVLVPYAVASAGAQLLWASEGVGRSAAQVVSDFALASSFGHYYYVFVITVLVLVTPPLGRCSSVALLVLFGGCLIGQAAAEAGVTLTEGMFWRVRDPLKWTAYFLAGWLVRLHYDDVVQWLAERRWSLRVGCCLVAIAAWAIAAVSPVVVEGVATWVAIYAVLTLLFLEGQGRREAPWAARVLSDATYGIFLLHVFFIEILEAPAREASVLAPILLLAAGMVGSIGVLALGRWVLGERSRMVLGA